MGDYLKRGWRGCTAGPFFFAPYMAPMRDALLKALHEHLMVYDAQMTERERMLEELADSVLERLVRSMESARIPEPEDEPEVLQLYCPQQGGWHTGLWFEGAWRAYVNLELRLAPTHWAPVLPDPEVPTKTVLALAARAKKKPRGH